MSEAVGKQEAHQATQVGNLARIANLSAAGVRNWSRDVLRGWDRFWFSGQDPATLGLIRILAGAMLFYTHFVWMLELDGFFGANGWLSKEFVYRYHDSVYAWSHLYWLDSPALYWGFHFLALATFACLTVGFHSRIASVLAALFTISYAHRASGALFGLDQINGFLALYLAIGPCGAAFSLDQRRRRHASNPPARPLVSANVAIRLIQIHLCIVYLFAGCGKLYGQSWWEGTALWGALANLEYQTLDLTWTASRMWVIELLTHTTLFWEISYVALIWPRATRPVMLLLAVPLHLGIAMCMGMVTFGLVMLIANLSFVPPALIRQLLDHQPLAVKSAERTPSRKSPRSPNFRQKRASRKSV